MKEKYEWTKMDKSELYVRVQVECLAKAVDMDSWENGEFRDRQTKIVNTAGWSGKASLKGDLKLVEEEESPLGWGSSQAEVTVGAKALPGGGPGMYAEQ